MQSIHFAKKKCSPEHHILEGNDVYIFIEQYEKATMLCIQDKKSQQIKKYDTRDIIGYIFGGTSSRFWFAKNLINLRPREKDLPVGMLCWNMVTIIIKGLKNLNLIIPN